MNKNSIMAKELSDRTTQDLFSEEKRIGRPRTNPMPRKDQLKYNKRQQVKREKLNGIKRIELKVDNELFAKLNLEAQSRGLSRSALIEELLRKQL